MRLPMTRASVAVSSTAASIRARLRQAGWKAWIGSPRMSTQTVTLFLALLALTAELCVVVAVALAIAGRWSETAARWRSELAAAIRPSALGFAFAVALVATLGSLYLSEVAHFVPCRLCWYQRIAMYPLAVLLLVAALKRSTEIARAPLPLIAIGAAISTYHYLLERFPSMAGAVTCDPAAPCTIV